MKNSPVFDDTDIIILVEENPNNSDIEYISEYESILADGDISF